MDGTVVKTGVQLKQANIPSLASTRNFSLIFYVGASTLVFLKTFMY